MPEVTASSGLLHRTKVHVEDSGGSGRPVVLIHGWPLSGEAWKDQVGPLTQAGYRVITYDRRGFGRSDKPGSGYDYDQLADDLEGVMDELDVTDATIVGFSMGGGEVARYVTRHGDDRLHSMVFASAVPPYMAKTEDNPQGPLDDDTAQQLMDELTSDRDQFWGTFVTMFYSVGDDFLATDEQKAEAIALCGQSDQTAAVECMKSFGTTDFRGDLPTITKPTLVIHGNGDGVVAFEGSGKLTAETVQGAALHVIDGAPHGCNVTHADEFNSALLEFLAM